MTRRSWRSAGHCSPDATVHQGRHAWAASGGWRGGRGREQCDRLAAAVEAPSTGVRPTPPLTRDEPTTLPLLGRVTGATRRWGWVDVAEPGSVHASWFNPKTRHQPCAWNRHGPPFADGGPVEATHRRGALLWVRAPQSASSGGRITTTERSHLQMATKNTRQTGSKAASAAGKVLANPRSTKSEKAAAASALAQAPKRR